MTYNPSKHSTTKHTPFALTYGDNPRVLLLGSHVSRNETAVHFLEAIKKATKDAKCHVVKQNTYTKSDPDEKRAPCTFKVGQQVMLSKKNMNADNLRSKSKLRTKYCGPFKVIDKLGSVPFRLKLSGT